MKFQRLSLYALVTIAAIAGTQSIALSQERLQPVGPPTLSETTSAKPTQAMTLQPLSMSLEQVKRPTPPVLLEITLTEPNRILTAQPHTATSDHFLFTLEGD